MENSKVKLLLSLLLLGVLLIGCSRKDTNVSVYLSQWQVPVLKYREQVDGNVSMENIPLMLKAGATMLVGGTSSVFREGHSVATIRSLIKEHTKS